MTKERLEEIRGIVRRRVASGHNVMCISLADSLVDELFAEIDRLNKENCLLSDILRDTAMRLRAHTEHVENLVEKTHGR